MRTLTALALGLALVSCEGKETMRASAETGKMWEDFSGAKALQHVQQLVDYGPRPPGSPALEKARGYIVQELEKTGWVVTQQEFTDATPQGPVKFVNLIATFKGAKEAKVAPSFLLCSHYDTKLFASGQFVGANDGGSSNGVLLELARVLAAHPALAAQMQLVFFDGEEAFLEFTATDGLYGSRYFAKQLQESGQAKQFRGGILFDMVGDKNLTITLPPDSPAELTLAIFKSAEALKVRQLFSYASGGILDDHTPLNAIGIPVIDLIDFDYPPWHTAEDTMDKISAESLGIVGSVAAHYLSSLK